MDIDYSKFEIKEAEESLYEQTCSLLSKTVTNTFAINNVDDGDEMQKEIQSKCERLKSYLNGKKPNEYCLVAVYNEEVIGTASCFFPDNDIIQNLPYKAESDSTEIGSVYISPKYQKCGIAKLLLKKITDFIIKNKRSYIYIDCGYETSQKYWTKNIGKAEIIKNSYFGSGFSYMIWKISPQSFEKQFHFSK